MKHFDSIEFGNPSAGDVRTFLDGSTRSYTDLHTAVIGIGTYLPGWKWSLHAKPLTGKTSERHIGYIVSGSMMVEDPSGNQAMISPGGAFEIGPGSDAWVFGNEPCVALDFASSAGSNG